MLNSPFDAVDAAYNQTVHLTRADAPAGTPPEPVCVGHLHMHMCTTRLVVPIARHHAAGGCASVALAGRLCATLPCTRTCAQHGLISPCSGPQVAAHLTRLQAAAAVNSLAPEDVSGGTITVSNIGAIGGTGATPLVVPPQLAIVALGRVRALPRFDAKGVVVPTSLLPVRLRTCLHVVCVRA